MKSKVLFIYSTPSSFVKIDKDILSDKFDLIPFEFGGQKGWRMIQMQIKLFFWLVFNIKGSSAIFLWFADYHGILPVIFGRLFRKNIVTTVGGYDAANIPEYNYGSHVKKMRSSITAFVLHKSDHLLPSSVSVATHLYRNVDPKLSPKVQICYLGFFPKIDSSSFELKTKDVICISASSSMNRLKIKGVDRVVDLARISPDINFCIVGLSGDALNWVSDFKLPNIEVTGWLTSDEITQLLEKTKVIIQLSRYEAFGMVLLEGMCQGCVPVTSINTGAAEVVVNGIGYAVDPENTWEIKEQVENILSSNIDYEKIRNYAKLNFSIEKRAEIIYKVINIAD
jgi:glycosyltransferase involved in cell wall biosynthesis